MTSSILRSIKATLILAVILCGTYPALVWIAGSTFFPDQSSGQLVYRMKEPVGSKLIGQQFSKPEYFHGRPSAAGEKGYDAANSAGSNLGPLSPKLADRIKSEVDLLLKENPSLAKGKIPVDLVTASGSGLDPHISPEAAQVQIDRIARARNLDIHQVTELVQKNIEGRQFGLLGEPRVNILLLNIALDELKGKNHETLSSK